MTEKQKPTSHRRTREELVAEAFRRMIRDGEAVRTRVEFGGIETKEIYKVEPNKR